MVNGNSMTKTKYVADNITWALIAMLWYYPSLFRSIRGLSFDQSRAMLWIGLVLSVVIGMAITWKKRRTELNMLANVAIPFGVHTWITYGKTLPMLLCSLVVIAVVLILRYVIRLFRRRIKPGVNRIYIIRKRARQSFFMSRAIISCCMLVPIAFLLIGAIFDIFNFSPTVAAEKSKGEITAEIEDNKEIIAPILDEDAWSELSTAEKLNVLQTVANVEACRLGLPHELKVLLGALKEDTLAHYSTNTKVITVDMDHLEYDSAAEVLNSICHEARHAYQHNICELYENVSDEYKNLAIFDDVRKYENEFSDYVNTAEDYDAYANQKCERDARNYAIDAMLYYYAEIEDSDGEEAVFPPEVGALILSGK